MDLNYGRPFMPLVSLTISGIAFSRDVPNRGNKSTEFTSLDDYHKDHNGESNQWHEWPAIVKSNLKSILVFVKHPPDVRPN